MTSPISTQKTKKATANHPQQPDTLAVLSIIFGVVSLMGPGLLLGIPAIVISGIALKKDKPGRGLSIAGLVTGIISTILSLLFIIFLAWVIVWSIDNPDVFNDSQYYPQYEEPAHHQLHT
jgi:hypothetical protein